MIKTETLEIGDIINITVRTANNLPITFCVLARWLNSIHVDQVVIAVSELQVCNSKDVLHIKPVKRDQPNSMEDK